MKCRSVACIWSGTPPLHRVTATAVLNQPPTLYTGGSDGSILWWSLSSSSNSNPEIKPVAMLCGHAAPVADLGICYPVALSGDGKKQHSSNVVVNSISQNYGALLSVCTDGVLCVWSRGSGHCRRRRKLPPWVGSPSIVRTLPSNPRYVCIACCFQHADAVHLFDHHSVDHIEASEASINGDSQHRKPPKCTLVIVDTYTLAIVQTIFHGHLSIGPLKFIAVVSCVEDREKHSVLMADSFGRLQLVSISKDSRSNREGGDSLQKGHSHLDMAVWADGLGEAGPVVSIATLGNIVALVLRDRCIFRLVSSGATIGEVSITDNFLCPEGYSTPSHITGGMFLESNDAINILNTEEQHNISLESFVVWSNRGSAIIYRMSYMDSVFKSQPLCEIPAASRRLHVRLSFCFIQLNHFLIRIESACFNNEEPLKWKPHVTIWSLPQKRDDHWKLWQESKIFGESKFFVDRVASSTSFNEVEGPCSRQDKFTSSQTSIPIPENINYINADDECDGVVQKERIVSSSMVISENFYTPYAVVYGFYSGEIEVVLFNMLQVLHSHKNSPHHEVDSHASRRYFSGHAGAVLCLAAHRMVGTAKGWSFKQVLVSGSMDCTIRLWDLDTGNLITVMHHHVAPVRQIILPPPQTDRPWNDCFLSVGEDSCVSLSSFETLRVERMFPGHPNHPAKVVWDCVRGYIACLCRDHSGTFDDVDVLHIWDIKTGARERTLRGTASHSMFDHFCRGINMDSISGTILNGNTSVSSLLLPIIDDAGSESHINNLQRKVTSLNKFSSITNISEPNTSKAHVSKENSAKQPKLFPIAPSFLQSSKHPIKCYCPFPGIATLNFDLGSLMFPCWKNEFVPTGSYKPENTNVNEHGTATPRAGHETTDDGSNLLRISTAIEEHDWIRSIEECILRFSLSFLHLWGVDCELDELLITEMKLKKPENFIVASGLQGDKGSLTLTFPGLSSVLELWKSSSEFCAMRSLTMVSLAQRMISLSHSSSAASSALAAFYTRNFAEKIPDIKPPLLQLLVSFWQDESEHVRMAARSLFHCAASRAIPFPLCSPKTTDHANFISSIAGVGQNEHENSKTEGIFTNQLDSDRLPKIQGISLVEDSKILAWLESCEVQDWISCVGGTSQDAMTAHIIVAAALAIWYPSLVQPSLAALVVHPLMKLVMAMNEKYSSTAAELLAEGMESTWKTCIGSEIPHLIGDIFFQIECVSGASANSNAQHPAVPVTILETLIDILLPSLAMADILGFLTVIESLIWSTASDSPVHLVSLMTLIRVVRGSPRNLVQHLDKAVSFILQTIEPGNSVMRKICLQSSMTALKEVARVFPMVALNDTSSRLAVGDAIREINSASIRVYDMQSVTKLKVLDASGPPGLPNLLAGVSEMALTTAISALSFSLDGEGLVAFSEHGLMIRWWSLGSVWWEKLSRNYVPVQCTKLIFVPPWEGFSSNSSRTSIMASITGNDREVNSQDTPRGGSDMDSLKRLIHNLDLSYRLEWISERKVLLTTHGHELGTFQL